MARGPGNLITRPPRLPDGTDADVAAIIEYLEALYRGLVLDGEVMKRIALLEERAGGGPEPPGPAASLSPAGADGAQWAAQVVILGANVVSSLATPAEVTAFNIPVGAGETWQLDVAGIYQTAATTTGIRVAVDGPVSGIVTEARIRQAADGTASIFQGVVVASGAAVVSASVQAANTNYGFRVQAVATTNASGTLRFLWGSEVAASNATLVAGSTLIARRVF